MKHELRRWSPFSDLRRDINSIFNGYSRDEDENALRKSNWRPAIDIFENENELVLNAELPGMTKDDIKIVFDDNLLTLSGEKKADEKINDEDYHRIERYYGCFSRSFRITMPIDREKISAKFKEGILEIKLPKLEEAKPKEIEINID